MAREAKLQIECPHCKQTSTTKAGPGVAVCGACRAVVALAAHGGFSNDDARCMVCGSEDLYIRKAFPKSAGIAIVSLAAVVTIVFATLRDIPPWAVYAPLFFAALIDAVLYMTTGNAAGCYNCKTIHFGVAPGRSLEPYNLEHAEELRLGFKPGARAKG